VWEGWPAERVSAMTYREGCLQVGETRRQLQTHCSEAITSQQVCGKDRSAEVYGLSWWGSLAPWVAR